ncbi:phage major capsid protein, partial [Streptococcus pneumoniae]|uniref:phage major capsid protein n=1 Tax=Streptococcus pneumoniae TaxID=1313 RepID=UPI0012D7C14E
TFDYVKEIAGEGAPATAAEGATKSQFDLDLQEVSVKAEWIAGFIKISRNMLDDVEGMTTFLGSRLPELLLRTEDAQILNGNGTSPNLSGITNTGNFTAFGGAATIDIEQLVQAISQLEAL